MELASDAIRLVPLGGLGEIGMNCLAVEQRDGLVIIDCGVGFPDNDLGIDVILPDFGWILERASRVHGVFLTHGHEDHIGALPYLLRHLRTPVWGPPHALGLVRRRLAEHDFSASELDLREAVAGKTYGVGPFSIEPVRVAHSIVEASALCLATAAGTVVHTGDFNLDPDPPDGEPTDEARLASLGDAGVALLLSDSTNVDLAERPGSERGVAEAVERLAENATGRVFVALFASNVQRLITFGAMAERLERKLCLLGRSLEAHAGVAREIGRVAWRSDLVVSPEQAEKMPRERVLVLAGGTQAEHGSAMRRLSLGAHPALRVEAGDTVIFSSRAIPGNERAVFGMMNDLLRLGARVHSRATDPAVHTSGHPGRTELERMLALVRPRCFVPVHGTLHHLLRHAELARRLGVSDAVVVEDGTPVVCDGRKLAKEPAVRHGKVMVAKGGEALSDDALRGRAELGRSGIVVVALGFDAGKREPTSVSVVAKGVPAVSGSDGAVRSLEQEALRAAASFREGRGLALEEFVRRAVRRAVEDLSGTRPIVEIAVTRVSF
ncbi:MAG TPA: ribonuclease J [Polyangiaceae bacterium]